MSREVFLLIQSALSNNYKTHYDCDICHTDRKYHDNITYVISGNKRDFYFCIECLNRNPHLLKINDGRVVHISTTPIPQTNFDLLI